MTRAVSVLEVADVGAWDELALRADLDLHTAERLDAKRRVMTPSFERDILPGLADRILVRYARRPPPEPATDASDRVATLGLDARRVLLAAQRHAVDAMVRPFHAWDPVHDAVAVRALLGAGLLHRAGPERYHLHPDLPPPPPLALDVDEALMPPPEDLGDARPGPVVLLHDLAALAAAILRVQPRRTHAGTLARADARRVARLLGLKSLQGPLEGSPRWARALRALEALDAVALDPLTRELTTDLGLDRTLRGDTGAAVDRLVRRLLDRDLHPILDALGVALRQAGAEAIDEVVFLDLLRDQQRDLVFPRWWRDDQAVYPQAPGELPRPWDADGFDVIEAPMVRRLLSRAEHLGLLRRAPGVFAATDDGRRWAGETEGPHPPVWISSDLEVVVPPGALTPWERFQLERLGRCMGRDVVDRYRLERAGLVAWLATHDLEEALALLSRRCQAIPTTVTDTLTAWAGSALRIVLTRGVLLPASPADASAGGQI